ncbi:MAG: class I SAM-dependent methyltransferase [Candidatus Omnitrophica bacterium]|nr:class I SAM-dependent methyltransferase [Candidatus Omnitrophota bacterium]
MPAPVMARRLMDQPSEGFESVGCILCGSNRTAPVVAAPDRDPRGDPSVWFQVVRCQGCGLHFQNLRPTAERLNAYYPEHYYAYQPTGSPPPRGLKAIGQRLEWWTKRGLRQAFFGYPCPSGGARRLVLRLALWPLWLRMRLLGKDVKVVPYVGRGRFLDLGCGTGGDLAYQRRCGLTVAGVERSQSAARAARERYGLDVRGGTLEEARFPDRAFDTIHMSHVFEHLPNPAATLDEMHRVLDPNGVVILKVPNIASMSAKRFGAYWLGLELPRHFYHFSPETITALLQRHGFAVSAIRHDPSSWGLWRESRRCQMRETQGKELGKSWLGKCAHQMAEAFACWRGRGGVIVVYASKG